MTTSPFEEAVEAMKASTSFYDVTIICTTDDFQAAYWMDLLESGLLAGDHKVLAVSEDWGGSGAGNGLGTLYAFQKACALATTKYNGMDLLAEMAAGKVSAALYHTAGKGTRMAPLPASENNNKPGVKLPFPLKLPDGSLRPLTVLESVVKQTGIYAPSRKGRLSVYWGDQVFLPSVSFMYTPTHHVDIMCTLLGETAPNAEEWAAQGLEKYGVIAVLDSGDAAQVEKVSHETATSMLSALGDIKQVGPSLGSFSVSAAILKALCDEFKTELTEKTAKYDTDPHFWMPLTLPEESYVSLMKQKGTDEAESKQHFARMAVMKTAFVAADSSMGIFGAVDVGKDACWWDYGLLKLYSKNTSLLLESSPEADLLRSFLDTEGKVMDSVVASGATVDEKSYLFCSKVGAASKVTGSLIAGVQVADLTADGAIIVNCTAKKIVAGKGAILYNLIDDSEEGLTFGDGEVAVSVSDATGASMMVKSRIDIDGGKVWKEKLDMNEMSFEGVHTKNKNADIGTIAKKRLEKYTAVASTLGL